MEKVFLYGAGINCVGVIKFLGKQNIAAVIDSDEKMNGDEIEGIKIISPQEYLKTGNGRSIFITSYFHSEAIGKYIEKELKVPYYKSPYIQMGFYEDCNDIIEKFNLLQENIIYLWESDPISNLLCECINKLNPDITVEYVDKKHLNKNYDGVLIITGDLSYEEAEAVTGLFKSEKIINLCKEYYKHYSVNNGELKKFRNIHCGKRCFIIGNGPSLTYDDLETLRDNHEICFAANRVFYAYEHTSWRPDYYVSVDYIVINKEREIIEQMPETKFLRHFYKNKYQNLNKNIYEFQGLLQSKLNPKFSFDIEKGIYTGNTVIYDALQIAVYMGFKEIYFLGVDMTSNARPEDEGVHFYKSPDVNEKLLKGNFNEALNALEHAKNVLEERGVKLRNATRGGELEVFERVDFDSLF